MSIAGEQAPARRRRHHRLRGHAICHAAVFTGSVEDVRRDLAAFFGTGNTSVSLVASDVVVNATSGGAREGALSPAASAAQSSSRERPSRVPSAALTRACTGRASTPGRR